MSTNPKHYLNGFENPWAEIARADLRRTAEQAD